MGRLGWRAALGKSILKPLVISIRASDVIESDLTVGIHKSVVTDFHEAGGQHVL